MESDILIVSYDAAKNGDMPALAAVRKDGVRNEITSHFVGQTAENIYKLLTMEEQDAL